MQVSVPDLQRLASTESKRVKYEDSPEAENRIIGPVLSATGGNSWQKFDAGTVF